MHNEFYLEHKRLNSSSIGELLATFILRPSNPSLDLLRPSIFLSTYGENRSYRTHQTDVCLETRALQGPSYVFGIVYSDIKSILSNYLYLLLPSYPSYFINNLSFIYHPTYSIILLIHRSSKPNGRDYYGIQPLFQLVHCFEGPLTKDSYTMYRWINTSISLCRNILTGGKTWRVTSLWRPKPLLQPPPSPSLSPSR